MKHTTQHVPEHTGAPRDSHEIAVVALDPPAGRCDAIAVIAVVGGTRPPAIRIEQRGGTVVLAYQVARDADAAERIGRAMLEGAAWLRSLRRRSSPWARRVHRARTARVASSRSSSRARRVAASSG